MNCSKSSARWLQWKPQEPSIERCNQIPLLQMKGSKQSSSPPRSAFPFVSAWHSQDSEFAYLPQAKRSLMGTATTLSRTERVSWVLIALAGTSKGFRSLPTIFSSEESAVKLVDRASMVQVCVVVSEIVSCRGGKSGKRHYSCKMLMTPSLCRTSSFTSEFRHSFSRPKNEDPSFRPILPIGLSSTDPARILKSYLAYFAASNLCFWLF